MIHARRSFVASVAVSNSRMMRWKKLLSLYLLRHTHRLQGGIAKIQGKNKAAGFWIPGNAYNVEIQVRLDAQELRDAPRCIS